MSVNTAAFKRNGPQSEAPRKYFDYSKVVVSHRTQGIFQLMSFTQYEDRKYGKPEYAFLKIRANFVYVVPNWEKAIEGTKEQQDAMRLKGHGHPFSLEFNPVVSPAYQRKNPRDGSMETTKPSSLYEFLRIGVNDGEPLTDEQLGRDLVPLRGQPNAQQKSALEGWMRDFNAALCDEGVLEEFNAKYPYGLVKDYRGNLNEAPIESLEEAMVRYPGFRLAQMLNMLEKTKAQFYATPVQKIRADGSKYVKLAGVTSLVPPEERLPTYFPYPRPKDPREEADDPSVVCSVTGERIRGWEGKEGWVTNAAWAAKQREVLGDGFLLNYNGKLYAPPFSPRFYSLAKEQLSSDEELPF